VQLGAERVMNLTGKTLQVDGSSITREMRRPPSRGAGAKSR
jgi:hypothetical protein